MKTRSTLTPLLVSLFLPAVAPAQSGSWTRTYPAQEPTLVDALMLSGIEGYAVGSDGTLLRTANAGILWTDTQVPSTDVRAIAFKASTGWAVGDGIFRSTDAGQLWQQTSLEADLNDVYFVTSSVGFVVGTAGRVLSTGDGGQGWASQTIPGESDNLRAVHFLTSTQGWVCGDAGSLHRTLDGGASWSPLTVPTTANLTDVHFADAQRGWLAAGNRVFRTIDGGASWSSTNLPGGASAERLSVLGTSFVWATGQAGVILRSSDGGASFVVQDSTGFVLHDISMGDLSVGIAAGVDGRIYRTTDGGASWQLAHGGGAGNVPLIFEIEQHSSNLVWATTTDSLILRSEDGGDTWQEIPAGLPQTAFRGIDFFDAQYGYAVGERQGFYPTVARTTDGGLNWNVIEYLGQYDFWDVDALAQNVAVACADNGLWRSTDGGLNWSFINTTPLSGFFGADFVDANTGWAVGWDIFRTSNGGASWTHLASSSVQLTDVSFADASHGWAVGANGRVLATQDGGAHWTVQDAGAGSTWLLSVEAVSPGVAWVAGSSGFVAKTTDGGATWTSLPPTDAGSTEFYGSSFSGPDTGFLTGFYPNSGIWRRESVACQWSNYCQAKLHSQGAEARISVVGQPSVALSPMHVRIEQAVTSQPGILIRTDNGPASIPFFGGTLCLAPPIRRFAPHFADATGVVLYDVDLDATQVGTTQWFQFWQRDPNAGDGTGVTLSDAMEVHYCE